MKESIVLFTLVLLIGATTRSQNISEIYKNEIIKLEAESGYGKLNNWEDIFSTPDFSLITHLGLHNQIAVAPEGSVFMSHKYLPEIWKFDTKGNFVKKFEPKNSKPGNSPTMPQVEGIFNGKYFFTINGYDGIQFFDFDGNHIKTLSLDFSPANCRSLENNKIAVFGYIPWKNRHSKRIIIIKDFISGEEIVIWSQIVNNKRGNMVVNLNDGSKMNLSIPGSSPIPRMATSKSGNLIIAFPDDGHVSVYSPEGIEIKSFQLKIEAVKIAQEDIDEYYNAGKSNVGRFEKRLKESGNFSNEEIEDMVSQYKVQLEKLRDKNVYPDHLPYFTNIIVDSEGNLLVFEYTERKHKASNKFRVYSYNLKGEFLNSSSFVSDEYKLRFSSHSFIFHNNYIYNVAEKKQGSGNLMRLVKFKVSE